MPFKIVCIGRILYLFQIDWGRKIHENFWWKLPLLKTNIMLYLIKAFDWDNTALWTIIFWWYIRLLLNSAFTIQKTPSSLFWVLHSENWFSENWNYQLKLHCLWGPQFSVLGNRILSSNTGIKQALGLSNDFPRKTYICRRNQRLMLGFDLKAPMPWINVIRSLIKKLL